MIVSGYWKTEKFKQYNLKTKGTPLTVGHLHPLLKVRSEMVSIFLSLGFEEMPTNNYVESSFWNFDALFQPQQHPARDAHDTFFLSEPALTNFLPQNYLERVCEAYQTGTAGSIGRKYKWDEREARKNILRTHTTAVSPHGNPHGLLSETRNPRSSLQTSFQPLYRTINGDIWLA